MVAMAIGELACLPCMAWGDKGHRVVALVAWDHLTPSARQKVEALLAGDDDSYPMRDGARTSDSFDRQATWADYYRDAQRAPGVKTGDIHSYHWHFVDIEIAGGSVEEACSAQSAEPLPSGQPASKGPDPDCVVHKIEQFAAELRDSEVPPQEKRLALKYLMHFVGDIHQPLHAADDHDSGGNQKRARTGKELGTLHHHWDTTFVDRILPGVVDPTPVQLRKALKKPSVAQITAWQRRPDASLWAQESNRIARKDVYGTLPKPKKDATGDLYTLDESYADRAMRHVYVQLNKAGVRLAARINAAFGTAP